MDYVPLGNRRSTHYFAKGVVVDHKNKYFGTLMTWPSDQTEIIITVILPSIEIWTDISNSIDMVR